MKDVFHSAKRDFQLERLILFSDAVFAIAITLLIIEIKPPQVEGKVVTDAIFQKAFLASLPQFIGFIMSFAMIGLYWSKHHQLFGYVTNYTPKLIFLNLFFLFTVVLMPYSTIVYSEFYTLNSVSILSALFIYSFNIFLCGVAHFLLWNYIGNPANKIIEHPFEKKFLQLARLRTLVMPFVFMLAFLVVWIFNSPLGTIVLFTIPLFFRLLKLFFNEKKKPKYN